MSIEKDKVLTFGENIQSIEVRPHPKEILDLDDETIAVAKAKLAGVDFIEIFGDEDRSSPELMIRNQSQKIRELFRSPSELRIAFSSAAKTREAHKDIIIDGIDLKFLKQYCERRQVEFNDDLNVLLFIGFGEDTLGDADV